MSSRQTILDVAHLAGVSIKTVSRVINDEPYVSAEMRRRVRGAIEELGFEADRAARAVRSVRRAPTQLISHFYGDPGGIYTSEIHLGILSRCQAFGYSLVIDELDYRSPELEVRTRSLLKRLSPDGVVISAPLTDNEVVLRVLDEAQVPCVAVSPLLERATIPNVRIDEKRAACQLTQHLIAYGHRRIGFIMGLPNHAATQLRLAGFEQALAEAGIERDASLIEEGEFRYFVTIPCAQRLLRRPDRPTAIFASNDEMAAAVIKVAHELNLRVPDDLSVVGFDDIPAAEMLWPSLTTVRQPVSALGASAADMLLGRLSRRMDTWPNPAPQKILQHDIVLRSSTAPAASPRTRKP